MEVLSSSQVGEWEAYDRLDPIGEVREDFRMAFISHLIVNLAKSIHGKRGTQMSSITDYMPNWDEGTIGMKKKTQSVEEMKQILLSMTKRSYPTKVDKKDKVRRK